MSRPIMIFVFMVGVPHYGRFVFLNLTLRPDGLRVKNNALAFDAAAGGAAAQCHAATAQLPRSRLNIIMNIIKAIG
jgi:hypothetical protein